MFFLFVFLVELGMIGFYLYLYRRQRGLTDLNQISQLDCKVSCLTLFVRLGWHFGLSLFNVVRINIGGYIQQDYKWKEVCDMAIVVMAFTLMHIIGYLCALAYQPMEYTRRQEQKSMRIAEEEEEDEDEAPQPKQLEDLGELYLPTESEHNRGFEECQATPKSNVKSSSSRDEALGDATDRMEHNLTSLKAKRSLRI